MKLFLRQHGLLVVANEIVHFEMQASIVIDQKRSEVLRFSFVS